MAKGTNNITKRSHSSKPYDVSNSFVKQVASRVSNLLPQRSWLNKWLTPTDPTKEDDISQPNEAVSEDEDGASTLQPPPAKRARIPLNQTFPADSFRISAIRNESVEANSRGNLSYFQDDNDEAGPSGLSNFPRSRLVSSTPATNVKPMPTSSTTITHAVIANGDDRSDSGESTSGCSSLVPQNNRQPFANDATDFPSRSSRRASIDEQDFSTYLQNSRSIFPNRPSPRLNSSLTTRQGPTFNASLYSLPFATLSPSSDTSHRSPFYPGPTAYGGASACRKRRNSFFSPNEIIPLTQSIKVKPTNRSDSSELSSVTARRILDTLDELSSPVRDTKRVPLATPTSLRRRAQGMSPRPLGPPTQDLTIPTVPDLLRLHRRMRLQDSLESARLIASSSAAGQSPASSEYRIRLQEEVGRHTGKMTSRTRHSEDETREDVHLPKIALPITSLPKFDIVLPAALPRSQGFKLAVASDISCRKNSKLCLPTRISGVTKSEPNKYLSEKHSTLISKPSIQSPVASALNFIPSCPSKVNTPSPLSRLKQKSTKVDSPEGNGPVEKSSWGIGVAGELKSGSVMDILGKKENVTTIKPPLQPFSNLFKPPAGSWECDTCLVRNKEEASQCLSCRTPRGSAKSPVSLVATPSITAPATVTASQASTVPIVSQASGFGIQFKPLAGTWQCETCLVSNKPEASSCIACLIPKASPKPAPSVAPISTGFGNSFKPASDTWECVTCMVRNKAASEFCAACEAKKPGSANSLPVVSNQTVGFGNKFKKPEGSWECPDCLVLNKEVSKCVACNASKPGTEKPLPAPLSTANQVPSSASANTTSGFGDMFKLPKGSWECPDCMLVNKDVWKCIACEATKPGIPGFGDMFKKPEGSWECPDCMVSNKDVSKCVACEAPKPGSVAKSSSQPATSIKFNFDIPPEASTFKFGVDKAGDSAKILATSKVNAEFQFGAKSSSSEPATFTFGKPVTKSSTPEVSTGFSFGNGISTSSDKIPANPVKNVPSTAVFSFGAATTEKGAVEKKTVGNENGKIGANMVGKDADLKGFSVGKSSFLPGSTTIEVSKKKDDLQVNNMAAKAPFVFGSAKSDPETTKPQESLPIGTFKFGNTPVPSPSVTSTVKVNGPNSVVPSTTTSIAAKATPLFGSVSSSTMPTSTLPHASFGTLKPSPSFGGFSSTTAVSFGQAGAAAPSTPSFGSQGKATSGFSFAAPTTVGQKRSCNDDEDRAPGSKKSAVGFSSSANISSSVIFGSAAATTTQASGTIAPVLSFGTGTKTTVPNFKSPSGFGASFSSGTSEGTASDKPVAAATPFVFGSNSSIGVSKPTPPPAYSFPTKQDSGLAPPAFGFGAATPATGGFNFTSPASEKPTGGFSFGSTSAPSFGNVSAVTPVFGSTPAAPPPAYTSPGFNFGGTQPPVSGVFSFSANAPAPAFTFGQAATPAAAATFDPNVRPSFNFTGGDIPQFTAAGATTQPSTVARRIKKAVRRAPR